VLAAKRSITPRGCWVSADHSPCCLCCVSTRCWTLSSREVPSQPLEKAVSSISLAQEVIWAVCCSAGRIHHIAHALLSQNDGTERRCRRINSFCAVWAAACPLASHTLARASLDPIPQRVEGPQPGPRDRSETPRQFRTRSGIQASPSPCGRHLQVFHKYHAFIPVPAAGG